MAGIIFNSNRRPELLWLAMKFFLDSAILSEIEAVYRAGICDGITMNPSLVKKAVEELQSAGEKTTLESYIKKILKTAKGTPVSIEVTERAAKAMVAQGKKIFKKFNPVAKNVCIKIPVNPSFEGESGKEFDGIIAIRELKKAKIPVNCTLVFTPEQALAAAKAGADFVSPFAGRVDDMLRKRLGMGFGKEDYFPAEGIQSESPGKEGKADAPDFGGRMGGLSGGAAGAGEAKIDDNGVVSGIDLVCQTVCIFRNYGIKTEVLAASMRNSRHVREAALAGADIATMGIETFREMLSHKLTLEGMKKFTDDAPEEYKKLV